MLCLNYILKYITFKSEIAIQNLNTNRKLNVEKVIIPKIL